MASADKPFRFPSEFTFVVRSFTVLDGIGKSLSPRFDISEIAAPYARELILDGRSAFSAVQARFKRARDRQSAALRGLFEGPLTIQAISDRLEKCGTGLFAALLCVAFAFARSAGSVCACVVLASGILEPGVVPVA